MRSGGARWIARGGGAACILVLPTLLLGSCMVQADVRASGPTLAEARDAFYATIDDTEDLLGGTWDVQDDPAPR